MKTLWFSNKIGYIFSDFNQLISDIHHACSFTNKKLSTTKFWLPYSRFVAVLGYQQPGTIRTRSLGALTLCLSRWQTMTTKNGSYRFGYICFTLRPAIFEIPGCWELEYTKWPRNYLKHLTSQVSCIHWILTPGDQIILPFALRPEVFKIQSCWKSEIHRIIPEWP